jgi:hypothetical protein
MPNIRNFDTDMQATRDEAQSATGFQSTVNGDVSTRSLVPIALEEALRSLKIPESWVHSDVREPQFPNPFSGLDIQLNVAHWSDTLALYAPLVESEIRNRLEWYQPTANHSRHVFAWRYMPQCGYPHTAIPDDTVWENPQKSSPDPVLDSLLDSRGNIRVG